MGLPQASVSVGVETHSIHIAGAGLQVEALFDNGSNLNLLSKATWDSLMARPVLCAYGLSWSQDSS